MPRVAKNKAEAPLEKKKRAPPKKKRLYEMPEHIPEGRILTDIRQTRWRIGPSIGTGGFGEIYLACLADNAKKFEYVVKCEPFENGPLFVEMHFYNRFLRLEFIKSYKEKHGLKLLGLPYLLGTGSEEINDKKHRFIVIPRYENNIKKYLDQNGGLLPEGTVYRIAIQMLDVFKFIHSVGYVHSDLKSENILLGYGKEGASQVYLVDYGLVAHEKSEDYKPDPKKMHNGTIAYTSRDAHRGITTKRTDLEIMGYNLIEWLGGTLPWIQDNLSANPAKVQQSKETFMQDVVKNLMTLFPNRLPIALKSYLEYVAKLDCADSPDYNKCKQIFNDALKTLKIPNNGELDFKMKNVGNSNRSHGKKAQQAEEVDTSGEVIEDSNSDDDFTITKTRRGTKRIGSAVSNDISPTKKSKTPKIDKRRGNNGPPSTTNKVPLKKKSPLKRLSPKKAITPSPKQKKDRTPLKAKANININSAITVGRSSPAKSKVPNKLGKTTLNSNLTPPMPTRNGNKYEFNIELDVSMDADVKVNVKRKKRPETYSTDNKTKNSTDQLNKSSGEVKEVVSLATRSKLNKVVDKPNVRVAKVARSTRK